MVLQQLWGQISVRLWVISRACMPPRSAHLVLQLRAGCTVQPLTSSARPGSWDARLRTLDFSTGQVPTSVPPPLAREVSYWQVAYTYAFVNSGK